MTPPPMHDGDDEGLVPDPHLRRMLDHAPGTAVIRPDHSAHGVVVILDSCQNRFTKEYR